MSILSPHLCHAIWTINDITLDLEDKGYILGMAEWKVEGTKASDNFTGQNCHASSKLDLYLELKYLV